MVDVSVIIPARNERFLTKTIKDVVAKSKANTEVIAVLEGYWPEEIVHDPNVHYIHFPKARGMRNAINSGVAIARGKFVMKLDAHCMVSEGFDEVLASVCEDNWICIPTRYRLDPINWVTNDGNRPPINYLYINAANDKLDGKVWNQKNKDRSLDAIRIDDAIACQGSMYFLSKKYYYELELLDEENYGPFRKDPQEAMFKAWCSGGRCVRVKDCWYAHLYKGKTYGRGYSASKSSWKKGDEYVKQWWTDSAWNEKQTIPFKEIIQRFPGMPTWENHKWFEGVKVTPKKLLRTYQYLEVDGKPFTKTISNRTGSRFWGVGKWDNFVAPHLPDDVTDQVFVEMGTDAGLFLRMAKDKGYRHVIGVEKNKTPVRAAIQYRDAIGYDYKVLKRTLGGKFGEIGSFDMDEMPVADLTLLSTFHYHVDINAWYKYLDRLRTRSCYVLVVSAPDRPEYHWHPNSKPRHVREYFKDWEEVSIVDDVSKEGDPKPRELFSILFKNPRIRRVPLDSIILRGEDKRGEDGIKELTSMIAQGQEYEVEETAFYKDWKKRKPGWSDGTVRRFMQTKVDLVKSFIEDWPKDPLIVQKDTLKLSDGSHRLAILETLGYQSVIVREI